MDKPLIVFDDVAFAYPNSQMPIFSHFSGTLPDGFVSLVGPNGSGKSTLMLLASGRLRPTSGRVLLLDRDTKLFADEEERNRYASFIYQNMEFETDDPLGDVLEQVYAGGAHHMKGAAFLEEVREAFELEKLSARGLAKLAKGEMQRALLAFAALYGSRIIFMDEPIFAMEDTRKERALDFFRSYQKRTDVSVYVSLHEIELTRKYADTVLLFKQDRNIDMGDPQEVLTREALEGAYGVPASMLKQKEQLHRRHLEEESTIVKGAEE